MFPLDISFRNCIYPLKGENQQNDSILTSPSMNAAVKGIISSTSKFSNLFPIKCRGPWPIR